MPNAEYTKEMSGLFDDDNGNGTYLDKTVERYRKSSRSPPPPYARHNDHKTEVVADFEVSFRETFGKERYHHHQQQQHHHNQNQYHPPPIFTSHKRNEGILATTQTTDLNNEIPEESTGLEETYSHVISPRPKANHKDKDTTAVQETKNELTATEGSDVEAEENEFPDVHTLLKNCESYMNWLDSENNNEEKLLRYIQTVETKYIFPNEKFEMEETMRWNAFQHISNLGACCFFFVELNKFPEAKIYVGKARDFIAGSTEKGGLPKEYITGIDYVWDYLCLHASVKEWEYTGYMTLFPEMNLLTLTLKFESLMPNIKAAVYCMKQYFFNLVKSNAEQQIDILRQTITLDSQYFEWYVCLQDVLRYQRIKYQDFHHIYPWDAEIQAIWTASLLAPQNPRCLLAGIQLLAEISKTQLSEPRWTIIRWGDINFHGLLAVKSYMKEQGEKIIKLAPRSVRINTKLASVFTSVLPYGHRDFRMGKECLERCLRYNSESSVANHRMADFFLTVDTNFRRAEMYYELALDLNEKSYSSLVGIIQIMLRTATHRKVELLTLIESQLGALFWDPKQIAGLHYFKALTYCANSQPREALNSFITAYSIHEKSLAFQDLPAQHRRYGWPGWPTTSKLSFNYIRSDLQKEKLKADSEKKKMIALIIRQLNAADANEKQFQVTKQDWRR